MKEIVFVWNDFQCLCRYKVFSEEVRQMLEQPIELLGKGFADIEDKVTKGNRMCSWHLEIKETQEGAYLTKKGKMVLSVRIWREFFEYRDGCLFVVTDIFI